MRIASEPRYSPKRDDPNENSYRDAAHPKGQLFHAGNLTTMSAIPQPDPFQQAHADGKRAVATFLPSLVNPPRPMAAPAKALPHSDLRDAVRAMSLANHTEQMSSRVANGLPPTPPQPTPLETFGNQLDVVHTRALASAIAAHPETQRARLISEAHDSASQWIMSHNGKVIVHGKVELAHDAKAAQNLAAKIVNGTVEEHDGREEAKAQAASEVRPGQPKVEAGRGGGATRQPNPATRPAPARVGDRSSNRIDNRPDARAGNNNRGSAPNVPSVGSVDPQSGRVVTHASADLKTAQTRATAQAPKFRRMLEAGTTGVKGARVAGVRAKKEASRARQKVQSEGKPANTISDLLAGRITVDSPEAKDQVVQNLKDQAPVIDEQDEFQQGDPDYGFRSHTLQTQVSPDASAEVQVVPREIDDADDDTHAIYEQGRAAEVAGDDETAQAAMDDNKATHDEAMDEFNERNESGKRDRSTKIKDILAAAGVKLKGEPIKLGGHFFLPIQDDADEVSDKA